MDQQILQQILMKLEAIEDEQKEMNQTLGKLESIEGEQKDMKQQLGSIETEQRGMKQQLDSIETDHREMKQEQQTTNERLHKIESLVIDIPLVRQAALETLDVAKRMESAQVSFERKVSSQLNTHEFGIDILNREQLNL